MKASSKQSEATVKKLAMRTLEILIIGAPGSGKTSLAQAIIGVKSGSSNDIETQQSYGIGMTLHKAKIDLPSGETVMLYLWDAKTAMTFKEQRELADIDQKSKGLLSFGATKPQEYLAPSESLL
jgi:GTPase SAR1 family protein